MDVSDLLRRLVRRWIAVLVIGVLAVAAAGVGWTRTGQSRQAIASVVIVPPKVGTDTAGQNPLLNLDNNLAQLATVLASAMQSPTVADALRSNGASGSFTVSTVTGTNPSFSQLSPQLQFTVTGATESATVFTARTIVSQAGIQLAALQDRAGVAAAARASLVESAVPTTAEVVSGSRLRVAGSIGLGVLVLGVLLVLILDAVLDRRRSRRPALDRPARPASDRGDHDDHDNPNDDDGPVATSDWDDIFDQTRDAAPTAVTPPPVQESVPDVVTPAKAASTRTVARAETKATARNGSAGAPVKPVKTRALLKPAEAIAAVEPAEAIAPVEPAETRAPIKPVETRAQAESAETRAAVEPVEIRAAVESAETRAAVEPVATHAPVKLAGTRAPAKSAETRAPAKKVGAKRIGPAAKRVGQNGRGASETPTLRAGR